MVLPSFDFLKDPAEVLRGVQADLCEKYFYHFLVYFWDEVIADPFVDNWHIRYLCDEAQKVGERVIARLPLEYDLLVNVSPGTSKSTIFTVMLPAWLWCRDASIREITGSYAANLATDHALKSRDVLKSPKFQELFPGRVSFRKDQDLKTSYKNNQMGERVTCSVGGMITGIHAHIIIIDDPLNPKQAASEVEKKTARDWMDGTLSSRKVDKAMTPTIVVMQRLAEDDPTGHILEKKGKKVKHICLPGEVSELDNVEPPEAEEYYTDGLFDPIRLSRDILTAMKIDLGSRGYAGQVLQSPVAAEGNIILRKWWQYYRALPMEAPLRVIQSWDLAFTEDQSNAATVCTTWNEYRSGYYLIDFFECQEESPEVKRQIAIQEAKHRPNKVLVEKKHAGLAIFQDLAKDTKINLEAIEPNRDKIVRAMDAAPTIEAGNVHLPEGDPGSELIVSQCAAFPGSKKADRVDSVTQFLNWARQNPVPVVSFASGRRLESHSLLKRY